MRADRAAMTKHPDGPLTDDDIDRFFDDPKKRHTLMSGSDTSRMANRILRRLYFDRRDLRRRVAELEGMLRQLISEHEVEHHREG